MGTDRLAELEIPRLTRLGRKPVVGHDVGPKNLAQSSCG